MRKLGWERLRVQEVERHVERLKGRPKSRAIGLVAG